MLGTNVLSMTKATEPKLSPAAKRDIEAIRRGEPVDLRYGPYSQLLAAGLIVGAQDNFRLVEEKAS